MLWLHKLLLAMVTVPVKWLVKVNSIPSDLESELGIDKTRPIVYLLRTRSITDQLALKMSAVALGLPKPIKYNYWRSTSFFVLIFAETSLSIKP